MRAYGVEWTGRDCPCCRLFRDVNYTHKAKRENDNEIAEKGTDASQAPC